MTEENKLQQPGAQDTAKLIGALVLVIGGIVAYHLLADEPGSTRWGAVVAGVLLGVAAFAWSHYGRSAWRFALDSRIELRKVVWPNRQETGMTTMVVFGFVVIAGLFFWVLDLILAWATRALTGQGS
jgi:preprotein translocase subunit SecE